MKKIDGVQKEYMIRFAEMDGVDINIAADIFGLRPRTLRDWVSKAEKKQVPDTHSEHPSNKTHEQRISTLEGKISSITRLSKIRRR
ncbi:hypothetical protein ACQKFG_02305 [Peribacillus sp. NPDC076916]|uniref:hypothetical protein n=1 Tax=Peribacillus sp. NPDC076916 TaxID=3390608 RepID=UPI003D0546F8